MKNEKLCEIKENKKKIMRKTLEIYLIMFKLQPLIKIKVKIVKKMK